MVTGFYLLDNPQPNTQQWGYPRRGAQLSGTCIVHTAECMADTVGPDTSAEGSANFIRNRSDYGSYHTLVDSDSIIEMVPYEYEAWQDSETNPWAVGISAAVMADGWATLPAAHADKIYRNLAWAAADFVAYMQTKGITVPLRRITGAEARARVPGFCAHGDSGISRHDPGALFDWDKFFRYTRQALLGGAVTPQGTSTKEATMALTPEDRTELFATRIQQYGPDGVKKTSVKPFAYIIGNLGQWVGRILDAQAATLAEVKAARADLAQLRKDLGK